MGPAFEGGGHAGEDVGGGFGALGEEGDEGVGGGGVGFDEFGDAAGDEAAEGGVFGGGDEFDAFERIGCDGGFDAVPDHEGLLTVVGVFGALGEGGGDGPALGKRELLHV